VSASQAGPRVWVGDGSSGGGAPWAKLASSRARPFPVIGQSGGWANSGFWVGARHFRVAPGRLQGGRRGGSRIRLHEDGSTVGGNVW